MDGTLDEPRGGEHNVVGNISGAVVMLADPCNKCRGRYLTITYQAAQMRH